MSDDRLVGLIGGLGCLVLVGSALLSRRLPARQLLTLALIWGAIFACGALVARLLGFA